MTEHTHAHDGNCNHDNDAHGAVSEFHALDVDTIGDYLLSRQLMTPVDIISHPLTVEDRTRRNRNLRIRRSDGSGLHIKQPVFTPNDHSMVEFVVREALFLDVMGHDLHLMPVRHLVPSPVYYDTENKVSVTQLIHPSTSVTRLHFNNGRVDFALDSASSCARLLARMHNATSRAWKAGRLAFIPTDIALPCRVLDHIRRRTGVEEAAQLFLDNLQERNLVRPLDALAERLHKEGPNGIAQGDLRWDNFLLAAGNGPRGDLNLRLLDWELVHAGNPLSDVAGWFSEYLRFRVERHPPGRPKEEAASLLQELKPSEWWPSAKAFWETYCRLRRWSNAQRKAAWGAVLDYIGPSLVMVAWEIVTANTVGGNQRPYDNKAEAALILADRAFANPAQMAKEWFDIAY